MKPAKISIIIPCLNEAKHIAATLTPLQSLRQRGHEVILVDGGSDDDTPSLARPMVDLLCHAETGRARQMNHGAALATGDALCFLHADTLCPENIDQLITHSLQHSRKKMWGRFDVRLSSPAWPFRIIEWFMNKRSCLTAVATGDQGIFICRNIFTRLGGFADIPLMEDIEISKRLRRISRPVCISQHLVTSSRRWEQQGILRTMILMWSLRLRYFLGSSAGALARSYSRHAR